MQKLFTTVLIIFSFILLAFIQDGGSYASFKIFIKPNCLYTQVTKNTSHSVVTFTGSKQYLDELKTKGIPNPTIKTDSSIHTTLMSTGKISKVNNFRVTINTDNPYIEGTGKVSQDKVTLYGGCVLGNLPVLDSVSATNYLDSNIRRKLMSEMETSLSRLNLPEQRIRLRETFSNTEPLKIPFGGNVMEVTLTTTYRLNKITNDIAYFTTQENYFAKIDTKTGSKPAMLGKGRGKFDYDIKKNYYVTYITNDTLFLHLKYNENLTLDIKSINGYNMNTTISAQQ